MEYQLRQINVDDPELWLGELELMMRLKGVHNEKVRFSLAAAVIAEQPMNQLHQLVVRIKAERCKEPYSRLRVGIMDLLQKEKRERVRLGLQMRNLEALGIRPSQWLKKLKNFWGPDIKVDDIIREVFMEKLLMEKDVPMENLACKIYGKKKSLDTLALAADEYFNVDGSVKKYSIC